MAMFKSGSRLFTAIPKNNDSGGVRNNFQKNLIFRNHYNTYLIYYKYLDLLLDK